MTEEDVIAREEIRALLIEYVQCADGGRTDRMLELFATDAVMEPTGDPSCRGRGEIRGYFERAGQSIRRHMESPALRHHLSSIHIELTAPGEARTTAYFLAITDSGPDHWGRYRDTLKHDGSVWQITHRLLQLEGRTPGGWLDKHEAARRGGRRMSIDRWLGTGRHPALLISECQNGLINPAFATTMESLAQQAAERDIVGRISSMAQAFRAAGLPVAHATIEPAADYAGFDLSSPLAVHTQQRGEFKEGTPLPEIHPGLTPHEGDLLFPRRTGMTSFFRSGLGEALRERGVDTIVLVGISTNVAIPGTTVEAINRGLPVLIAEDATAATTPEIQEFTFRNILPALATITTSAEIVDAIGRR